MEIEELYHIYEQHPVVVTDTRKLESGCIFFALKGDNFDGNDFALTALQKGAAYAVVDKDIESNQADKLIRVDNVLSCLQKLAKYHRQQFHIPFIAITGSNGKTTTKELVNAVLSAHYKTYCTQGNLNNHIGIPLTILSIKKDAEIAVIEMGANHQKEIEGYCKYTLPTHGIITNCGKAHLEGFGGIEGVRKGKGELFDYLRKNDKTAFIFSDYDYLIEMSVGIEKVVEYGTENADVTGHIIHNQPFISVQINKGLKTVSTINTQLAGDYNLPNILCAVAVGNYFDVPTAKLIQALHDYHPSNNRSQWMELKGNKIILDAYNANPSSMKLAIENMANLKAANKYLLLGAMMELGEYSVEEHAAIIDLLKQYGFHKVVLVGGDFEKVEHPFIFFKTALEAKVWFQKQEITGALILIKGSRSIGMEKVLA